MGNTNSKNAPTVEDIIAVSPLAILNPIGHRRMRVTTGMSEAQLHALLDKQ